MTGKTHISVGLACVATLLKPKTPETIAIALIFGELGALMPDADSDKSAVVKLMTNILTITPLLLLAVNRLYKINVNNIISALNLQDVSMLGVGLLMACIILARFTPHRSFSHSYLGTTLFGTGVYLCFEKAFYPFMISYISHILIDTLNHKRVNFTYPIEGGFCFKLVETNKFGDNLIGLFGVLVTLYAVYMNYLPKPVQDQIRFYIKMFLINLANKM